MGKLKSLDRRAITERSKEHPVVFDDLLKLLEIQPEQADSLLAGIERAVLGIKGFIKPAKWDKVSGKLMSNPNALKLNILFGDQQAIGQMEKLVLDPTAEIEDRSETVKILLEANSPNLKSISEQLLKESEMKIWGSRGLSKFEGEETGQSLVSSLSEFADREVDEVVEILCGRVNWADALLNGIENGKVAKSLISPYHALQIKSLGNEELNRKLTAYWGKIRESPEYLSRRKDELKLELTPSSLAKANLKNGSFLYDQQCSGCHRLYGRGGLLGPDLTGSGRSNLEYLLENIVDPNGAVSADYRMNILKLKDGRILSGMT